MSFDKIIDLFGSFFKKTPEDRNFLAVSGSQFIKNNMNLNGRERDKNIVQELSNGNVPNFLREMSAISVSNSTDKITYYVTSDYLSIGSDEDYVRIPMTPIDAQVIADQFGCMLPTRKMVNDIWRSSTIKLAPLPWGPPFNIEMHSTYRYGEHSNRIQNQLSGRIDSLISGHKKDVVLTNKLYPKNPKRRVAIYGWIQKNGVAIQDLNPSAHEDLYADYSHGIRLISKKALLNDKIIDIIDILKEPKLCSLLSDEGILNFVRY